MNKLKLLLVVSLAMLGSSVYAVDYVVNQKFTSVGELDGKAFAIVNEAEGKAVYGSGNQNLAYNLITTAVTGGGSGYYFKIEESTVPGGYLLRLQTPAGDPYTIWGSPGYLNAGAPNGFNGCFILGLNNRNGQDVENGAVWEIESNGVGFALKNVAHGGYFAGPSPAPSGTDPIYWTFCTLKEDILGTYNDKKNLILSIDGSLDVSAADALAAAATTDEEVNAAISALYTAFGNYLVENGNDVDVTSVYLVNPSFEIDLTGWTNNGMQAQNNDSFEKEGSKYCEAWQPNGTKSVSQTLSGMPIGKYKLTAKSKARGVSAAKLFADIFETPIVISDNTDTYELEFGCKDNLTIGFEGTGTGAGQSWLCVDDFKLTYVEGITEDELDDMKLPIVKDLFDAALAEAQKFDQNSIPSSPYTDLQIAISTYNTTWSKATEYEKATEGLNKAVAKAKEFVQPYANFLELKALADKLALAGTDNPTGQAALKKSINKESGNVEGAFIINDINVAYAALKEEMTKYANASNPVGEGTVFDITFMLTNPDLSKCEGWKPADGWYCDQTQFHNSQVMNTNQAVANTADPSKYAFYEYWSNNAEPTEGYVVYQKLTLPEGTYKMTALAVAGFGGGHRYGMQTDGSHGPGSISGEGTPNITFSAGDIDGTSIVTTTLEDAAIDFVQAEEGEVKIGLKAHEGNQSNWMGIGYVQLFKVPAESTELDEDVAFVPESKAGNVTLKKTIYEGWNTIALPFGVDEETVAAQFGEGKLYKYTGCENGVLSFATATAIAPHTPYLFKSSAADGTKKTMSFAGVTISSGEAKTAGVDYNFVGTYSPLAAGTITSNDFVLAKENFQKASGKNTLRAFRAYIQQNEEATPETSRQFLTISLDGETTSIKAIDGENIGNDAIYNLAGQQVKKVQKGLYIQNCKKLLVK